MSITASMALSVEAQAEVVVVVKVVVSLEVVISLKVVDSLEVDDIELLVFMGSGVNVVVVVFM